MANDITVDAAGNVYVTGRGNGGPDSWFTDYLTIKYEDGNELWVRRYEGPGTIVHMT